jgi:hypothetical protein
MASKRRGLRASRAREHHGSGGHGQAPGKCRHRWVGTHVHGYARYSRDWGGGGACACACRHSHVPSPLSVTRACTREGPRIATKNESPPSCRFRFIASHACIQKYAACLAQTFSRPSPVTLQLEGSVRVARRLPSTPISSSSSPPPFPSSTKARRSSSSTLRLRDLSASLFALPSTFSTCRSERVFLNGGRSLRCVYTSCRLQSSPIPARSCATASSTCASSSLVLLFVGPTSSCRYAGTNLLPACAQPPTRE